MEIGLTKTQAKIYLKLIRLGGTVGSTIAEYSNVSRPEMYRVLDELQKIGLVQKEVASPNKYTATPLKDGLNILLTQELKRYEEKREKAEHFLLTRNELLQEKLEDSNYRFVLFDGKERIEQIMNKQHGSVLMSANILSTYQRWLHILDYCIENYKKALKRNVKYRVIIGEFNNRTPIPDNIKTLIQSPNFQIKFTRKTLANNLAIFDNKIATFNFYPSKSLNDAPIILTNHPGFISMANDQFENIWKSSTQHKAS